MPSSKDPVINRQKAREYALAHPEWKRRTGREWMRKKRGRMSAEQRHEANVKGKRRDPIGHMLKIAKKRADDKGVPFDIEPSDLTMPDVCPVLGIEFKWGFGKMGWRNMHSPSLDRIKPQLGYVRGNVRVISIRANHIKGNATISEMQAVLDYMKREGANWNLDEQEAGRVESEGSPPDDSQMSFGWC